MGGNGLERERGRERDEETFGVGKGLEAERKGGCYGVRNGERKRGKGRYIVGW